MIDVTKDRLTDVFGCSNWSGDKVTSWTEKSANAKLTNTELAVIEQIRAAGAVGIELGFIDRALLYAQPIRAFTKPERRALYSLLARGTLRIMRQHTPDCEYLVIA